MSDRKLFYCFILVMSISCNQTGKSDSIKMKAPEIEHDAYDDTLHWSIDRIGVIMRCRDLDDSANNIYMEYAQGKNTYENYINAKKVYFKEYDSVYVPLCDKLGIKYEGGKK